MSRQQPPGRPSPRRRDADAHTRREDARGVGEARGGSRAPADERIVWAKALTAGRDDGRLVAEDFRVRGEAQLAAPPAQLHPEVATALANAGIGQLYSHQAQAIAAAWERDLIVTTGTASGKSLCFNIPTLDVLCRDTRARALYLYPTKALAQDQARALARFGLPRRVRAAIYDGDTPRAARAEIRRNSNVVLTNPDMLHVGILPNHEAWAELFGNLAVVVIDEAHVYRGVFGSHVGNVLRRLRRIANAYGTTPRFLLASATIANPLELAQRLTGIDELELIDEDGAPAPARQTAIWNPPLTDERAGTRASAAAEGAELLARLVSDGARAICFVRSRKGVELVSKLLRDRLASTDPELARLIAPYRAGYTPQQRREIESKLINGELRAVISTDALELGIDIGELDAAVVVTFPGTVASLRQMWGRAGRRGSGLAVYVAGEDALDQFFCRHPDEFLERPVEAAILDHESIEIHLAHLLCAAYEGPLSATDAQFLGSRWETYAETLVGSGLLRVRDRRPLADGQGREVRRGVVTEAPGRRRVAQRGAATQGEAQRGEAPRGSAQRSVAQRSAVGAAKADGNVERDLIGPRTYVPRRPGSYPAGEVSLRSASPDSFAIVDVEAGELLGTTESARAHSTVHRGAIYMHLGRSYEVLDLDIDRREALVRPFDGDWYTQPKTETETAIERLLDRREALGVTVSFGEVSVTETVVAYQRKRLSDHAQIDLVGLDLPQSTFATQALWYELPRALVDATADVELPLDALLGALHAAEHSQIAVLPLIAMCDRWDIGGLSTNLHPQTGGPTIFIYDGHPGGIGIARTAYARFEELCDDAHRLIAGCSCESGCPSCVQSPKCGNLNEPLSKLGAQLLLARMTRAAD